MSSRTLERRFARLRASERFDFSRVRSLLCDASFSRSRDRLFCLSAEEVRVASESRRRVSWVMTLSRCRILYQPHVHVRLIRRLLTLSKTSSSFASVALSSSEGLGGMLTAVENWE